MADLTQIEYSGTTFTIPVGGVQSLALSDLEDVALSTSPPAGELLGFDGSDWTAVDGVLATALTGLDKTSSATITSSDTVISALGKLQAQLTAVQNKLAEYSDTTLAMTDGTTVVEKLVLSKNTPTP